MPAWPLMRNNIVREDLDAVIELLRRDNAMLTQSSNVREFEERRIPLIEDACESHGATFKGRKVGSFGLMSNFSFYYAHHMSTVEGGMVCTSDGELYEAVRMLRSHGMVRESQSPEVRRRYEERHPDL